MSRECPGCGRAADHNMLDDAHGQSWHRRCLERRSGSAGGAPGAPTPRESEAEWLEHERDLLRRIIEALKDRLRGEPKGGC